MTVKGGSRPACAACRFQRRRCASDCPLAPHFPANQPKMFQNVHRLYGVGNIMKILNQIEDEEQKEEAMKSIKYESYIRQIYRVDGCYGLIAWYERKCVEALQELQYVRALIDACKKNKQKNILGLSSFDHDTKDQVVGDLGFYYNGLVDHNTSNYELPSQYLFDEFHLYNPDQQPERSTEYSEGSFVDDPHAFMGPKEAYDFKLESSFKDAKTNFVEAEEIKVNGKLFEIQQGVGF